MYLRFKFKSKEKDSLSNQETLEMKPKLKPAPPPKPDRIAENPPGKSTLYSIKLQSIFNYLQTNFTTTNFWFNASV